jgi:aerobic-type carbon monoxide dehydrogenase small subunit (CoxS/CutS family)
VTLDFTVDGVRVSARDTGASLLEVLRDELGVRGPKDGCSPQGQCGCCTVLVDGAPRVACVTPARRVVGRSITTIAGLPDADEWARSFCATGGSQCGFCTPGIVVRLSALRERSGGPPSPAQVEQALLAHLCRCTGWRTILEASDSYGREAAPRDWERASQRAALEGGAPQRVGPDVALGLGGFADDLAPRDALVAVPDGAGGFAVAETLSEARRRAEKVQGRRTTLPITHPIAVPSGDWDITLRTTWVEPAYLELDASWCEPGGEPATPLANGGAFGGKLRSPVAAAARRLADEHGRAVRVLFSREDATRLGAKRPPIAAGVRRDGTGEVVVARTAGIAEVIAAQAPGLRVTEVDVAGPPTSSALRAAGWAEAAVLVAAARGDAEVRAPSGATARAEIDASGRIAVSVSCGEVLDEIVLRSYCVGAAHMAFSWVTSEGIAVDERGSPLDLTVRSFGVLRARDTPEIEVRVEASDGAPVNGSDAVFAAVAAATWIHEELPPSWPTRR